MRTGVSTLCDCSAWGDWYPLEGCWRGTLLPSCPGLYRVQLLDSTQRQSQLVYIGQSGNLKERIGGLKNVYSADMPYKAPHTAAPALWALRHVYPSTRFEVSVAPFPSFPGILRLGLECLALALHRQQEGRSPLANFGRMPAGYRPSSGNDVRLQLRGKRFRGGPTSDVLTCHLPGCAPLGSLDGDPHAREWCGHTWTPWVPIGRMRPVGEEGLYRLRIPGLDPLIFLGQGQLADRLAAIPPLAGMESSWVSNHAWHPQQRLELLTDLVGAHVLSAFTLPLWQFDPVHARSNGDLLQGVS